jgi:hypothetical protein
LPEWLTCAAKLRRELVQIKMLVQQRNRSAGVGAAAAEKEYLFGKLLAAHEPDADSSHFAEPPRAVEVHLLERAPWIVR